MLLQDWLNGSLTNPLNTDIWIIPFLEFGFIIFLMLTMIYCYKKMRIWVIMVLIYGFSLIFGMMSIMSFSVPFSPYIQMFFILFQTLLFITTSIEVFRK
jgi:hypothetical protein